MKKTAWVVLALAGLWLLAPSFVSADRGDDLKAIKKAVQENPGPPAGKDVQWFKVLITEAGKEKVRISLPIGVVEAFMKCADGKNIKFDQGLGDMDLAQLFAELKKAGPMAIVEINDGGETVKVWLE
ncbi:MAG: hypothetical protein ACYDH0_10675 [Candidatus Aminicenantales bacterium]